MSNQHALRVYSALPREGEEQRFIEIGHAVSHPDQKGYNIYLQALPANAELVLRDASEVSQHKKQLSLTQRLEAYERSLIEQCLMETGGRIDAAMEKLNVPRRTLSEKIARLGIDRRRFANGQGIPRAAPSRRKGR